MKQVALWYQKSGYSRDLAEAINSLDCGYRVHVLPEEVPTAVRRLATREFDLVETDELLRYGSLASLISSIEGIEFVCHVKGWDDYLNSHGQYNVAERAAIEMMTRYSLRNVDALLFVTRRTRQNFAARFALPSHWRYAMPVFDVSTYENASPDRRFDDFCLLTVTNLRYEEKLSGVGTILKALEGLLSSGFELRYRIAGGGRYLSDLEELVGDYSYSDRVEVLGYREDVPRLLASADLFVYVSYLDSLATTVLEAQAAGLPVVASDTGGIPEAVGDAGIVCPPDPTDLERCIRTLLQKPTLRQEFSTYARDRMKDYRHRQAIRHVEFWDSVT